MSKEAEEFFRQKTIENAKRPRMKKFLALVNREEEGKIMQEYTDKKLRELLKAYAELVQSSYTTHFFDDAIEESIDEFIKKEKR